VKLRKLASGRKHLSGTPGKSARAGKNATPYVPRSQRTTCRINLPALREIAGRNTLVAKTQI
jgi:hypothetical protein